MDDYTFNAGATFATGAEMPEDAVDLRDAASVRVAMEAIGDNTAILNARYGSGTLTRMVSPAEFQFDSAYWTLSGSGVITKSGNLGNAAQYELRIPVRPPRNAVIQGCFVRITAASGHSAQPANKPTVTLIQQTFGAAAITVVSSLADTGGVNVAAYEAERHVSANNFSPQPTVDTTDEDYWITFRHESGSDSIEAGFRVHYVQLRFTVATYPVQVA